MRKMICLIMLAGMIVFAGGAIAEDYSDGNRARLGDGRIYLMYDLETGALCYVTSMGGISCTHRGNIGFPDRFTEVTNRAHKEYTKRNRTAPHMIVIGNKPKEEPKPEVDTKTKKNKKL